MEATVLAKDAFGNYSVQTENNILLVFPVVNGVNLALGDELEVDMMRVMESQTAKRTSTGQIVDIRLEPNNIHDLDIPIKHGGSRTPSPQRMVAEPNNSSKRTR